MRPTPIKLKTRAITIAIAMSLLLTVGCDTPMPWRRKAPRPETPTSQPAGQIVLQRVDTTDPTEPDPNPQSDPPDVKPAPAPAGQPPQAVMAYVNKRPLYMSELHDLLVRTHGMRYAQQMIINEIVRQEAANRKITVTDDDIDSEHDRTVREAFPNVSDNRQRAQLWEQMLQQRQLTRRQWRMAMRRNAMVRKMVPPGVTVTDSELKRAFEHKYGHQVVVRHIQTPSLEKAQTVLSKVSAGEDFAQLAARESTNETGRNGGLMPAFGRNTASVWPAFRQAALALTKVGEVSNPVQVGTAFHVIRLERIIPPAKVTLKDVKPKLFVEVRQVKMRAMQQQILSNLIRRARTDNHVTYVDPVLKAQTEKGSTP